MASMNWLGFSLSSHNDQELAPSQPQHHRFAFASDDVDAAGDNSGECCYLTSDHSAAAAHHHSFAMFQAFNTTTTTQEIEWGEMNEGLRSNKMSMQREDQEPKLENLLGRHSSSISSSLSYNNNNNGDHHHQEDSSCASADNFMNATTTTSNGFGLSMIKTWLRNQPNNNNNTNEIILSEASSRNTNTAAAGANSNINGTQTHSGSLSLCMNTGGSASSSSPVLPLLTVTPTTNATSSSIQPQDHESPPPINESSTNNSLPRKSIDTFGQRTSIYRGVTRHRWTGRYEAHLWDNSCRREGQTRKGRQVYLGGYDKEEKAARAYDLAALKYWGTTTTTNFPISNYEKELEEMKHMTRQEYVASLRRKSSGFSRGASIYRGVTRHHQHGRWQARIGRVAGNKDLYLGTFSTQEEAAEAYDIAAIKFRGLNAVTNFDMSRYDVKSILDSSSLPIGASAKRLKDALLITDPPPSIPLPLPSTHTITPPPISLLLDHPNPNPNHSIIPADSSTWHPPPFAAFHYHQYNYHPYSHQFQRMWCKQEQDCDESLDNTNNLIPTFHHHQQNPHNNSINFLHSNNINNVNSPAFLSMDSSSSSHHSTMGFDIYADSAPDPDHSEGGYANISHGVLGLPNNDQPLHHDHNGATNLYYNISAASSDNHQVSACTNINTNWVPTAIPTSRSTNLPLWPQPFSLLHDQ